MVKGINMKILIVEDEAKIREFISLFLKKEGYEILEAKNGAEGLLLFKESAVDMVLLDIMMPEVNGFQVCSKIRENSSVPILILTAVAEDSDQILGYELGADDYIIKPFKINILMAKIKRLLKSKQERVFKEDEFGNRFNYESLHIDFLSRILYIANEEIMLSPKEFDLIEYFILNKGISLSRDQILEAVWGYDYEGGSRVVDNHVKKLRKKLGKYEGVIQTINSVGYKFSVRG